MSSDSTPVSADRATARTAVVVSLLALGVLAAIPIGLGVASDPAAALFPTNNVTAIDDTATIVPSGGNVHVTGTTNCTAGEIVTVEVRVEQGDVVATGQTRERCLGADVVQAWSIRAATHGPGSFEPGDAHVWAEARTADRGRTTDTLAWDAPVTLVERP